MAIGVKVRVVGAQKVARSIERAVRASAARALPAADLQLGNEAAMQIESEGAHLGLRWQALRPATVIGRKKRHRYYKKPSGSGPEHPMVRWTGRIHAEVKKPGRFSKAKLTVTREYVSNSDESEPTRNRLVLTHFGDPTVNRVARPIFFIEDGNRMARRPAEVFKAVFEQSLPTEAARP